MKYYVDVEGRLLEIDFQEVGEQLAVTISVGVGIADGPQETVEMLLKRADEALYAAKNGGRNRVCMAGESDADREVPSNVTSVVRPRRSAQ